MKQSGSEDQLTGAAPTRLGPNAPKKPAVLLKTRSFSWVSGEKMFSQLHPRWFQVQLNLTMSSTTILMLFRTTAPSAA